MATDPCSYKNPTATRTTCIANGGKPNTDPCNILNPVATASGCAATEVTKNVTSGMSDWQKVLIVIGIFLVLLIITIVVATSTGGSGISGGKRRFGLRMKTK